MYRSSGVLTYVTDPLKVVLLIDRGIYDYYRSLIPRYKSPNPQRYPPHVSVVRNETPRLDHFGRHEGLEVEFEYDGIVREGSVYFWLNVFSTRLEEIRVELGLPVSSEFTLPPEGFTKCFHTTIGNKKRID